METVTVFVNGPTTQKEVAVKKVPKDAFPVNRVSNKYVVCRELWIYTSLLKQETSSRDLTTAMQPVPAATEYNDWSDLDDDFHSDLTTAGCNILLESNSSSINNRVIEASKKR
ncbi:hypothetical protein SAY87_019865 [Trapa incisa]|uniref:Uncharacterized protein n=1 Tax=Trapa incisa TaxID=236973 RepID=A0AAN7K543_9MYRT|nr:hypothetical protein SAY87_019865 [Trapa incisa]